MEIKIDNFKGPLDLLLQLIEREELDITEVSLVEVAEQYISYLSQVEYKKPDMLADFLLIAAKLLYIKSCVLLPELSLEEEEDTMDLAEQLRLYKKFVNASKHIKQRFESDNYAVSRQKYNYEVKTEFIPPTWLDKYSLYRVFRGMVSKIEESLSLEKQTLEKVISIKDKIAQIEKILLSKGLISFSEIAGDKKVEKLVSFLGILELSKQRKVFLEQSQSFGEIQIQLDQAQ